MGVHPGCKCDAIFRGGIQLLMMESKIFFSNNSCELENDSGSLVFFNGQSVTFGLSIKAV